MESIELEEKCLLGGPYSFMAISPDNSLYLASTGSEVEILSSETTPSVRKVLIHDSEVVGLFFDSNKKLITVTSNGEVTEFQINEDKNKIPTKIESKRVTAFPVVTALIRKSNQEGVKSEIWLIIKTDKSKKESQYELGYVTTDSSLQKVINVPNTINKNTIVIEDDIIAYCNDNEVTSILLNKEHNVEKTSKYVHKNSNRNIRDELTKFVRIAAKENFLVVSTVNGQIFQWSNLKTGNLDTFYTTHWHKVAPYFELTQFGNVISGGAECALVRHIKGQKIPTILPRLIAPIIGLKLSDDGSIVFLLLENRSFHTVLLSTMAISLSFSNLNYCDRSLNTIFKVDAVEKKFIAANGKPGEIQWIDPSFGKTVRSFNLTLENVVDGDMEEIGINSAYKDLLNIGFGTKYYASIEKYVNFNSDHTLRFWKRKNTNQLKPQLISTVSVKNDVVFITMCQEQSAEYEQTVITASTSGTISIWEYSQNDQDVRENIEKRRNWQEAEIDAISNLQPNGRFASAHDRHVVLWNVKNMKVIDILSCEHRILKLDFFKNFLIIATKKGVVCWDTLSLIVLWRIEQKVNIYVSITGCFAIDGSQVMKFDAETGKVVGSVKFSAPVDDLVVSSNKKNSLFYVAKTNKGILSINPKSLAKDYKKDDMKFVSTPFQELGKQSRKDENQDLNLFDENYVRQPRPDAAKLFAGPVHSLPPISFIAPIFIEKSLLPPPIRK